MFEEESIKNELRAALSELSEAAHLEKGAEIVVGCSTSEIAGGRIGKASVPQLGVIVAEAVLSFCREKSFEPVFQCCEHLNRSLVIDTDEARRKSYRMVCAVPKPKAGGSAPSAAWKLMEHPCLVESVQADAGIDIGDTLIGMHLRSVAVPFRSNVNSIGNARLIMAFSRLPYVGGERAKYTEDD